MTPPVRIAILGSCITRDPFSFFPDPRFELVQLVARTSPISLTSPPCDVAMEAIAGLNGFEQRSIHRDFTKQALDILDKDVDLLLLDFVEDRYDLAKIGETYVICSPDVVKSGVLAQFPDAVLLRRGDPEVAHLWARGWLRLLDLIRAKGLAHKLVLHAGRYGASYVSATGERLPFSPDKTRFAELNQIYIDHYQGFARASAPDMRVIALDAALGVASATHKWGLQPYHYIDDYYREFMRRLAELCGLPEAPLSRPDA